MHSYAFIKIWFTKSLSFIRKRYNVSGLKIKYKVVIMSTSTKFDGLNEMQRRAVFHTEGPVLILAGAGSGKTRVLTHRIAYLIEEKRIAPWNILAITFTNKAANEMKERVGALVGAGAEHIWVSTFHSACVRILRSHIDKIGYQRSFGIYDMDDQKALITECLKQLNMDKTAFPVRSILGAISSAKDQLITPNEFLDQAAGDFRQEKIAEIYRLYQKKLMSNNALDFDDIIVKTVELFRGRPDVLEIFQEKFKYIHVDEYQDTNMAQYHFIRLLASKYKNLCVVGDDDQSIYRFRGANIRNILDFEKDFTEAYVIKLEQNYRCTKTILNVANQIIKNNAYRKTKTLWTDNDLGHPLQVFQAENEGEESAYIIEQIIHEVEEAGREFKDFAILYRTNAQSRVLEEQCIKKNIPYKMYGGVPFYQRKEIKDLLSYLRCIHNPIDDLSIKRIINVPRRGIGAATIAKVEDYAEEHEMNFFDVLLQGSRISQLGRNAAKLSKFAKLIGEMQGQVNKISIVELVENLLEETGYVLALEKEGTEEAKGRIENINELISKVADYEQSVEEPSLNGLLEEVALVAAIDNYEEDANAISMMTLHSAKGLEFPQVFIAGFEEGVFPSYMCIVSEDEHDLEEERRLCYVGVTRAQQKLYLSYAKFRMMRGTPQYNQPSRFILEIPQECITFENQKDQISMPVIKVKKKDQTLMKKPYQKSGVSIPRPKNISLPYDVGDEVKHIKFGKGKVINIEPGGADYQVTVEFSGAGIKKMLASFAKLKQTE